MNKTWSHVTSNTGYRLGGDQSN